MADARAATLDAPAATKPIPWSQRLVQAVPLAPIWTGLGISAALLLTCIAYYALLVDPGPGRIWHPVFWREIFAPAFVMSLVIGYAPAATAYSRRAAQRTLEELRPVLRCSPRELADLSSEITCFDMRFLRLSGLFAVVCVSLPMVAFDPSLEPLRARAYWGEPNITWVVAINVLNSWMVARLVAHEIQLSRAFSRIGAELVEVDVLNPRPLLPLARRGLQGALVWIVCVSLFSLLFVFGADADAAPYTIALLLGIGVFALVHPVWGVHRRLGERKRAELDRLVGEIRAAQDPVVRGGADASPEAVARLATLLSLKQHVEAAREWPFDFPTLARFVLYLAIGLGSWLGAALVERLLDAALTAP